MVELNKLCKYVLAGCALAYIVLYCVLGIIHVAYPYEIEVTEGQSLEQVRILLSGGQFYVAPSLEFTPFIYPPLYYYISAALAKVIGLSFVPLRLVSFLSSLCGMLLIYLITAKQSKSKFAGVIAAGLYAATYEVSGIWFDVARVDSVFMLFLLLALYFLNFSKSWKSDLAAGVALSLCFLSKQTAIVIAVPLFIYAIIAHKKRSLFFILPAIGLSAIYVVLLNHFSQGWFTVYLLMPFQHEIETRFYMDFFSQDIAAVFIASVLALYYLLSQRLKIMKNFFLYAALGMMAASWASRLHRGGWNNALFPAYAIIAILCGLSVAKLLHESSISRKMAVYAILFVQFAVLFYNPLSYLPPTGSSEAGLNFMRVVEQIPDPVFMPNHPYLLSRLEKEAHAHSLTIWDFFRTWDKTLGNEMKGNLMKKLEAQEFNAIIIDNEMLSLQDGWFTENLNKYYVKNGTLFVDETVFWTVSGVRTRPETIYVKNESM